MSHPVLFVIDDDPGVVRTLRDDLGRRFGEDFRVLGASSAAAGLAMLCELADEHVTVAVLIAGHQLREMPGVEFLARAHRMHPRAKRVLLVERDYSARSPVIRALTLGQADYHICSRGCSSRISTAGSARSWPNGPRTAVPPSSCSTSSGGWMTAAPMSCASC